MGIFFCSSSRLKETTVLAEALLSVISLEKTDFLLPEESIADSILVGAGILCILFLFSAVSLSALNLYRSVHAIIAMCVHTCNRLAVSRKHCFLKAIYYLWLSQLFTSSPSMIQEPWQGQLIQMSYLDLSGHSVISNVQHHSQL